jgi:hypothetical protein
MTWISNPTAVAEPGMWHLRKEDDDYLEFVHRRTGEVIVLGEPMAPSKCTSRPDCPCDFCVRVRAEIAEGRSKKDEENRLAEEFLRSYSRGEGVPRSVALKEWARKNKYSRIRSRF